MYLDKTLTLGLRLRPLNVLLVEDEPATMSLMEDLILNSAYLRNFEPGQLGDGSSGTGSSGAEHRVFRAYEAEEGLDIIRSRGDIDLVFLDYHLPKMNGNLFCKILRSSKDFNSNPSLWIVAHTREQRPDLIEELLVSGANNYMVKPVVPSSFLFGFRVAQYGIARLEHLYRRLEVKQKIIDSSGQ